MVPYTRSQSRLLRSAGSRSGVRWADVWCTIRYILSCLVQSLFKLWDLNPVSLGLRRWRQLHHMSTAMALSIHPRLIDLATDFLLSDDRRKRKLLSWVKSILPRVGEDVFDFTACWHDGIVLCSLIEAINPGACPRFGQLKPHHRVQNCRLGLQLAMQYLQVTQLPLCPEEMAIADDKTEVKICHLVQLLKWKYQKQGSKPTVFSIFSVDEPPPCKCQARGTGIRAGIVGRRAKFNILVETATRLDLDIEIRGPNNEYNKEKIVSVDTDSPLPNRKHHVTPQSAAVTEEDGKSKIIDDGAGHSFLRQKTLEEDTGQVVIPFDYQCVGEGRFLVTYIPRNAGLHYITVLSGGVHISGSPFEVKVSDWVSSWNLVPKSRVAPTDMLHSVEGKQADNGDVSKDATTKVKRQISQVAHMSQQLTRMKRRVLRKVITANGEEIICDVIPALSRQKSQDLLLPEEDTQQTEAVDQADTDTELSCFKYVQSNTFSDGDNDVGDNNHSRVERITQAELRPCWLEQQAQNESRTPTIIVTHDDHCDSSDVNTVNTRDGNDPSISDNPTGDLKDSGGLDSLEHAFKDRRVCPSPTNMHPKGYSPRSTAHSSLDGTTTTIKDNDFSLRSYSLSTKASPGDRSSSSGRHSPSLHDTTISGHVLEDLGSRKKECKALGYSKTMRSVSADDMCLKRGSNVLNENAGPLAVDILESITYPPEILYSFSDDQNDTAVCQRNTIPCTSIVVLNSPNSKSRESFPDFSLLQISSSKEECGGNGLYEIAPLDQTDIMNSDKPTDDGLLSSLHYNTDQRFEVNGSNCCPAGHFTDKLQAANQAVLGNGICGVIEKVSDIPSVENQTDVTGMAQHQDLIACKAREDAVGKAHFCNDVVSRACNVSREVKTEHVREIRMASSCDIYDCHYEVDVAPPFYKNGNARHKLAKSWSDPYRDDNVGGKSRTEASPAIIPLDSTVHLNKPELELLCSDSETGYKDMHTNQYKIEILNSDGLNRPYFCFKDGIHCDDKRRRHGIVDPTLAPDEQNENKGEHCLQNGKGDGAISIRSSSGDGSPNLKKLSIFNKMSQIDGTIAISHSNGTTGEEELYSDEDEILHIVIVPKISHSDHEGDICNQESRVFTTPSTQTNDNILVREDNNVCMSVSENSSPVFDEETGNTMSREQMEEINGVSPFSDVSKISGNSDWSDIDDAARRLSERQTSTYTSSRYFLKGDWSPQFVELNYQGGVRSRRRSSTRSACSLSPSACSHRTKHSITSLLDGADTDTDRINAFMGNGRRLSDQIRDKDVNETLVKVYSLGNDLRGKPADTGNNDLQMKVNNHPHAISKQCVSTNSDHNRPNTTIETTGSDGCKLYLRRRRKPVYIHECSRDKRVDKDDLTNSAEWQHTHDIENSSTYFIPRPQQKNTAGLSSHRKSTAGTFFSQMELWSPDLSDCLPVDNWSSLNNSWIGDQCEHITDHSRSNNQWREDIVLLPSQYKVHRGYIESFQERTLTPTKYRKKERATSRTQSCRDQKESYIANSRFYTTYYGDQHARPGVEDHRGLVTESCSTQGVLTFGDKFLTPTRYRRQKRRRVNCKDKPQMLISCEVESNPSDVHSNSPELDKSQKLAYKDRTKTTQAQKHGHAIPQTTHRRLDPMLGLKQPNSSEAPGVSQVPTTHNRGNRKYKYSEMRRGFRGNCSYENFLGESQDASVGQPCSTGLCLEYPQERSESIGVRTDDSKRTGIWKTKDAPEENMKGFSNTAYDCINTNSHDESSCQCCDTDAVYVSNHRGHEKNPGEDPMYYSHLCDLQQPQKSESRHHERLMHHQHQQHLKKCPPSQRSPLAIPRRHSDLRVRKLECHKLPYLDIQEGMQHKHYNLQDEQPSRWQGLQDEQREQISEGKDLQEGHELHEQTSEGEDLLQEEQHAHTSAWQDLQAEQHEYKSALQGLQKHELHEQTSEEEDLQEEQHAHTSVWQDLQAEQHSHTSAWQDLQEGHHAHTSAWQDLQAEQHSHTSAWQDLQEGQHAHTSVWQDLQHEQTSEGEDLLDGQYEQTSAWQEQLDASGDGDMRGIYRSGMRRQSTVETMDSGITDGSSHYSSQLSYTDTAFYSDLPGCDDQNFHMRLFLAMA